jgi:putative ABC transport system permease protein
MAVRILNQTQPLVLERYPPISLDLMTLGFTLALTVATGLLFGAAPGVAVSRIQIQDALKAAGTTQSAGRGTSRMRQVLVVAELAVSLVLLIGAGLLARSFLKLARVEPGFAPDHLLAMHIKLNSSRYATADGQMRFWEDVLERMRQLPMVRAAAVANSLPLGDLIPPAAWRFQVMGRAPLPMAQRPTSDLTVVSRDYFRTLEIPLIQGAIFDRMDSVVVNQAFVRKIFPNENPIGRRIALNDGSTWAIAGVVGDIRAHGLGAEPTPGVYRCECLGRDRFLTRMGVLVRTSGDPAAAIRAVEGQVFAVDRNQPVFDVKTMQERLDSALAPQRFQLLLIGCFAGLALVLAAAGVYGVMAYLVTRRTREIGIRIAMGARPEDVLRLVLRESAVLAVVATVAGLGGAWVLTRHVRSMLYGVTALDAVTFTITPLLLVGIVLFASMGPARRAARVDPVTALREE